MSNARPEFKYFLQPLLLHMNDPSAYTKQTIMLQVLVCLFLIILPFFFLFINFKSSSNSVSKLPRSYPLVGSAFAIFANRDRQSQWIADILSQTSTGTLVLHGGALGVGHILTANPLNVEHILKTKFSNYPKGHSFNFLLSDLLGSGIFNTDGDKWKFQRQISSHEFNAKSLRKFVETVVETELSDRLIPILSAASANNSVLDLQDVLQRFAFDNICKISFGFDPQYLSPSFPQTEFAVAFDEAVRTTSERFFYPLPAMWKMMRFLNIGSEKRLKQAVSQVRGYAEKIVKGKKKELNEKVSQQPTDLLSRILSLGHSDDAFLTDMVMSFILAGRDTTSAALTWFFWLISCNPEVEQRILKEIKEKPIEIASVYEEVKDMVYTHASICESMRLYPAVPSDTKEAAGDDVLPDGTVVKKGTSVTYHPYTMGRMERLWGANWEEFKPERWLKRDEKGEKWCFVGRDPYTYPVFQAGPRICLGKEMAFLQMKRVVAGVLTRFRVVPAMGEGFQPEYVAYMICKMKDGFPVRIEDRDSA